MTQVNYRDMTPEEQAEHLAMLQQAMSVHDTVKDVVASVAFRWAFERLKSREKFGDTFASIPAQALPRETILARASGLSETEVSNLKKATEKALDAIKL